MLDVFRAAFTFCVPVRHIYMQTTESVHGLLYTKLCHRDFPISNGATTFVHGTKHKRREK